MNSNETQAHSAMRASFSEEGSPRVSTYERRRLPRCKIVETETQPPRDGDHSEFRTDQLKPVALAVR